MTIHLVLSVTDTYFHQSHFLLGRIPSINPASSANFKQDLQLHKTWQSAN